MVANESVSLFPSGGIRKDYCPLSRRLSVAFRPYLFQASTKEYYAHNRESPMTGRSCCRRSGFRSRFTHCHGQAIRHQRCPLGQTSSSGRRPVRRYPGSSDSPYRFHAARTQALRGRISLLKAASSRSRCSVPAYANHPGPVKASALEDLRGCLTHSKCSGSKPVVGQHAVVRSASDTLPPTAEAVGFRAIQR